MTGDKALAGILVNIDIREGLQEDMDIGIWEGKIQILNYKGIQFICKQCCIYGHLTKDCELPLTKKAHHTKRKNRHKASKAKFMHLVWMH